MARREAQYRTKAVIKHNDGRVHTYYHMMTLKEFDLFFEKICKPQGDTLISVEEIKPQPVKYYS